MALFQRGFARQGKPTSKKPGSIGVYYGAYASAGPSMRTFHHRSRSHMAAKILPLKILHLII